MVNQIKNSSMAPTAAMENIGPDLFTSQSPSSSLSQTLSFSSPCPAFSCMKGKQITDDKTHVQRKVSGYSKRMVGEKQIQPPASVNGNCALWGCAAVQL
jgi:hypothetical protein